MSNHRSTRRAAAAEQRRRLVSSSSESSASDVPPPPPNVKPNAAGATKPEGRSAGAGAAGAGAAAEFIFSDDDSFVAAADLIAAEESDLAQQPGPAPRSAPALPAAVTKINRGGEIQPPTTPQKSNSIAKPTTPKRHRDSPPEVKTAVTALSTAKRRLDMEGPPVPPTTGTTPVRKVASAPAPPSPAPVRQHHATTAVTPTAKPGLLPPAPPPSPAAATAAPPPPPSPDAATAAPLHVVEAAIAAAVAAAAFASPTAPPLPHAAVLNDVYNKNVSAVAMHTYSKEVVKVNTERQRAWRRLRGIDAKRAVLAQHANEFSVPDRAAVDVALSLVHRMNLEVLRIVELHLTALLAAAPRNQPGLEDVLADLQDEAFD